MTRWGLQLLELVDDARASVFAVADRLLGILQVKGTDQQPSAETAATLRELTFAVPMSIETAIRRTSVRTCALQARQIARGSTPLLRRREALSYKVQTLRGLIHPSGVPTPPHARKVRGPQERNGDAPFMAFQVAIQLSPSPCAFACSQLSSDRTGFTSR